MHHVFYAMHYLLSQRVQKDSGSKNYTSYVSLEPEASNGQYMDPLGNLTYHNSETILGLGSYNHRIGYPETVYGIGLDKGPTWWTP